jgi:hypothetical protein
MKNLVAGKKPEALLKNGILSLFGLDNPKSAAGAYARFKVCRGYIDDLNRILSIRLRIQLETEIGAGKLTGEADGPRMRFSWEFLPDAAK